MGVKVNFVMLVLRKLKKLYNLAGALFIALVARRIKNEYI
jgi:hypothetical protein